MPKHIVSAYDLTLGDIAGIADDANDRYEEMSPSMRASHVECGVLGGAMGAAIDEALAHAAVHAHTSATATLRQMLMNPDVRNSLARLNHA